MFGLRVKRRSFLETLLTLPVGIVTQTQGLQPPAAVAKVAAGVDRFNAPRKLPGGDVVLWRCRRRTPPVRSSSPSSR
jgi:hypothetical protein